MKNRTVILIVGHGSREPAANLELESLVDEYRASHPQVEVAHAYIELAAPSLSEALAQLGAAHAEEVVVVPLFLFAAGHVKNDIPLALDAARRAHPQTQFLAARSLGVDPRLAALLHARAAATMPVDAAAAAQTAVLVVGRGASDPDANGDFCKLVRLYGEGRGFLQVTPTFIGITRPLFAESLELCARARPERVLVLPYLLFGGRLITKLREQLDQFTARYPWIPAVLAPHLGVDPLLFSLIDERVNEARTGRAPLPCDTCQYRTPMPGREENVGGLRAMLWSLRHSFTHTQAVPHVHAHKPVKKHVLVCGNADCADRGSLSLVETLRRMLKDAGRHADIKITRTSCMGRCGEGPTVVVYPDGIWYRAVTDADARELCDEHLLADRLVARLVDNIMQ